MSVTNSLIKQVDLPVWEWLRFCPIATAAVGSTCISEEADSSRYLYYLGATFWRYDTKMDSWQQLATPNVAAVTASSLRYAAYGGYHGNVLGATSTTVQIAGLQGGIFNGKKFRVTDGTGAGEYKTITSTATNVIHDSGLITGVITSIAITDTTKRWEINQYIGYSVRIVNGAGQSQTRKVLYNSADTLYFYDATYHLLETWNNNSWSAVAPFAIPVTTAGLQANYYIESTEITVDSAFDVIPDESSSYIIESGGIYCFSSAAATPFSSMQYYDIASDTWLTRTPLGGAASGGLLTAAYGVDFAIERTGQHAGYTYSADTVLSSSSRTITATTSTYTTDALRNAQVRIFSGTGQGQRFRIIANSTNAFEIPRNWDTQPDATSAFEIWPNTDEVYLVGGASSSLYKYSVKNDYWYTGNDVDYGQCRNISIKFRGQEAYAMLTGTRNTGGITTLSPQPTVPGTGYAVGDLFNITTGGSGGKGRVEAVSGDGITTRVSLYAMGSTYTTGTGKATTNISGTGAGLTVNIVATGTVGRITTVQNTNLYSGDSITISGCSEAAWNGSYHVAAIDSVSTFDILITASSNAAASNSQSTLLLVDASKNWTENEHTGKLVILNITGVTPTNQVRRIVGNSSTVLTLQSSVTAGANGISRYVICQPDVFGKAQQYDADDKGPGGYAISGTTNSLTDSTKNWFNNQWIGYKIRIHAGAGVGSEFIISGNTTNTLNFTTQTFTPDTTTRYRVMDSFGLLTAASNTTNAVFTDSTKRWITNQWAGRRVKVTSGPSVGEEKIITSNSVSALTLSGVCTNAPDTASTYCILDAPLRGLGTTILWAYSNTGDTEGRYLYSPRGGGSNIIDRYDIQKNSWDLAINTSPKTDVFTTGTMYAYDGANGIIIHRGDATATLRTMRFDVNTQEIEVLGMPPYTHGTPLIGNRMETLTTEDGLKYLYVMRHTGQEMWRTLLF